MHNERLTFEPKLAQEKLVLAFNFEKGLAAGETLTGSITVIVTIGRGKDAAPSGILNGSAQFDVSNKKVLLPVQAGIPGVEYNIRVVSPTTNINKQLAMQAVLPVI